MHSNFKGFQVAHPSPIFHAWDMPYKAYTYTHACNMKFLSSTFCYRGKEKKENTQQIRKQGNNSTHAHDWRLTKRTEYSQLKEVYLKQIHSLR